MNTEGTITVRAQVYASFLKIPLTAIGCQQLFGIIYHGILRSFCIPNSCTALRHPTPPSSPCFGVKRPKIQHCAPPPKAIEPIASAYTPGDTRSVSSRTTSRALAGGHGMVGNRPLIIHGTMVYLFFCKPRHPDNHYQRRVPISRNRTNHECRSRQI